MPSLDPVFAKEQYLNGHRLPMPTSLHGKLSTIYGVMQGCWHPLTEARMAPHTILRDLNQLLYRIFNSKKVRDNFGLLAFCSFFTGSLTVFHNSSTARQH